AGKDSGAENSTWARENPGAVFRGLDSRMGTVARLHQAHSKDTRAGHKDRGGQDDGVPRAAEKGGTMKKPTNWDLYFRKQLGDPEMRGLIEEEIESLRVGIQIAGMRQKKRLSQAQLAARAGMSATNISRIENS